MDGNPCTATGHGGFQIVKKDGTSFILHAPQLKSILSSHSHSILTIPVEERKQRGFYRKDGSRRPDALVCITGLDSRNPRSSYNRTRVHHVKTHGARYLYILLLVV